MAWINTALLFCLAYLEVYSMFLFTLFCYVSLQGTSDFCVSPNKFIVNQTKDFVSAGNLYLQVELYKYQPCHWILRHNTNLTPCLHISLTLQMLHTIICSAVRIYQTPSKRYWQTVQSLTCLLKHAVVYRDSHTGKCIAILKWVFPLLDARRLDHYLALIDWKMSLQH